jgi:hypothetical protein
VKPFASAAVARTFESYPPDVRRKLLALRELILATAYLTSASKSGSTVRIAWKKSAPSQYAMYFNCQTTLVDTFRTLFPREFRFDGNRAIVFDKADALPADSLAFCVAAALTYHRGKTTSSSP